MTGHANLARGHHQELAALKRLSVFLQDGIEVFDLGVKVCSWESKEDDARVSELMVEDQLAEVAASDYQHPSFWPGDRQDILIGKPGRIVARDGGNVMTEVAKMGNQPKVGALVEQEIHRVALDRATFGGCGETSSPVTRARA